MNNLLAKNTFRVVNWTLAQTSITKRHVGAYEGHGRTTVQVENNYDKYSVEKERMFPLVAAYSQQGFRLTNTTFVYGPMIIYKGSILFWNIGGDEDINEKSLEVFFNFDPPLDLLVVGFGQQESRRKLNSILTLGIKRGLPIELQPTTHAVSLYNSIAFDRNVAAAFVPPMKFHVTGGDLLIQKKRLGIQFGRKTLEMEGDPELIKHMKQIGMRPDRTSLSGPQDFDPNK